ncbi:serine/threonine-protein phosphatase [Nocardioides sp. cx-169]|uniref:PP2C family protein-serine/threonine phosphatase n=1 Tax=Nocardioides sp. cx-169 TaxID=2899080 RepID=UPI001E2A647B|nr:PP2C family protein-serine/threonine phosphatase [Nocardioides sp. cx-169]MCD4532993.1 serine/threonine-protein phosphatase [Nocardioides sp. cx-169]
MPPRALGRLGLLLRDRGLQAGFGVLALLVLADLRRDLLLTATYSASAIIASMLTTARRTAAVAVAGVVLAFVVGYLDEGTAGTEWLLRAWLGVALAILAVVSAVVRDRREERLRRMTVIAATAQQALLSSLPARLGEVVLAARYVSATAAAQVGGDLYEASLTPNGVRMIIGDVKGKGLEAVQVAASVLSAFRHAAVTETDIGAVARTLDATVAGMVSDEDFVTAIVAEFTADRVTLANCGHPSPVLVAGRTASSLEPSEHTLPLGLGADPVLTTHDWPEGARMLLYTDGLVEARDSRGRFFSLDEHADDLSRGSLEQALDHLVDELLQHAGTQVDDDLALVLTEHHA